MSMCVCCEVKISPVVIMSMCVCVCVCRKHLTTAFLTVLLRGNYLNHPQKWWGCLWNDRQSAKVLSSRFSFALLSHSERSLPQKSP